MNIEERELVEGCGLFFIEMSIRYNESIQWHFMSKNILNKLIMGKYIKYIRTTRWRN